MDLKTTYRNRLPHIAPIGATFFITFRLGDALPLHLIRSMRTQLKDKLGKIRRENPKGKEQLIYEEQKRFFGKYDQQLDEHPFGACWLKNPEIADMVSDKLHSLDGEMYELQAFCIMPNHVHILIDTMVQLQGQEENILEEDYSNYVQLDKIMKLIKGGTARAANKLLGRSGKFWQKDSYDHYVRNEKEWDNIVSYILQNPVKAKLVEEWLKWPYTFYKYR